MRPLPQFIDDKHEEINDPIDELTQGVSAACEIVDEMLAARMANLDLTVEIGLIEDQVEQLVDLDERVREVNSAAGSTDHHDLLDDALDTIMTMELLVGDVETLIADGRRLLEQDHKMDPSLASDLRRAVDGLSGSIHLISTYTRCMLAS
jgi:hypothetical protein